MMESLRIFVSYVHEDKRLLEWLEKHLTLLLKQGLITIWHDRDISAGTEWTREINTHLNTAQVILLLISSDFLASDYCYSIEMKQAMAKHDNGEARVIPIILRYCEWQQAPFGKLQALPNDGNPVMSSHWAHLDEAFFNIATGIRSVVEELTGKESGGRQTVVALQSPTNFSSPVLSKSITPDRLPRPKDFVGRDAEITKLMASLRTGESCGICAINGMGGVGKTALAAEIVGRFILEHELFPGGAAWIFCENLEGLDGLLAVWRQVALALKLEQVIKIPNPDEQRQALTNALSRFQRILLVLDNIEPKLDAQVLLDTLAIRDHTALLLTARQVFLPEKLTPLILHPLPISNASQLFVRRLNQIDDGRPMGNDASWIPQIMSALGRLPLAIELVAAYAGVQHLPLADILKELDQDKLDATSLNFDPSRAVRSRFKRSWAALSRQEQYLFASLGGLRGMIFPRQSAVALAQSLEQELKETHKNKYRRSTPSSFAKGKVAKLVSYALVEPVGYSYLRLHPLLREYAFEQFDQLRERVQQREAQQQKDQPEAQRQENLVDPENQIYYNLKGCIDQENAKIQDYPSGYRGLGGTEAEIVWEVHREAFTERWKHAMDGRTSREALPTTSTHFIFHAQELLKLSLYMGETGEQDHARKYLLESLRYSEALKPFNVEASAVDIINLCHWYLALFDEYEGNYAGAAEHYSEVLHFLELNRQQISNQMLSSLKRIRSKAKQFSVASPQDKLRGFISIEQIKGELSIYEIRNKPLHIGRSSEADIFLDRSSVSRKHIELLPLDGYSCGLKDESSINGTWLNNQLMNKHQVYPLRPNDAIRIGEIILVFTKLDHSLLYFLARTGFRFHGLTNDKHLNTIQDFFAQLFFEVEDK